MRRMVVEGRRMGAWRPALAVQVRESQQYLREVEAAHGLVVKGGGMRDFGPAY